MKLAISKFYSVFLFCFLFNANLQSQSMQQIHLWPGTVPGETEAKAVDVVSEDNKGDVKRIAKVTDPIMDVYQPAIGKSNGVGIIICPGGGYGILAIDKEGYEIATWLKDLGYTAFVLHYRVPQKRLGALQDAQRAMRFVKSGAQKWGIDAEKIGIMGFSAGGSLSARLSTLYGEQIYEAVDAADKLSCKPAFTALIYPAYLDEGPNRSLTSELKVTDKTSPMFLFETADDPYGNSALVMAGALRDAKVPVELHYLPFGGHGYGLRKGTDAAEAWPVFLSKWLMKIQK